MRVLSHATAQTVLAAAKHVARRNRARTRSRCETCRRRARRSAPRGYRRRTFLRPPACTLQDSGRPLRLKKCVKSRAPAWSEGRVRCYHRHVWHRQHKHWPQVSRRGETWGSGSVYRPTPSCLSCLNSPANELPDLRAAREWSRPVEKRYARATRLTCMCKCQDRASPPPAEPAPVDDARAGRNDALKSRRRHAQ